MKTLRKRRDNAVNQPDSKTGNQLLHGIFLPPRPVRRTIPSNKRRNIKSWAVIL